MKKAVKIAVISVLTAMVFSGCMSSHPSGTSIPSVPGSVPHTSVPVQTVLPEYTSLPMETHPQEASSESHSTPSSTDEKQDPQLKNHIPGQNKHSRQ